MDKETKGDIYVLFLFLKKRDPSPPLLTYCFNAIRLGKFKERLEAPMSLLRALK